MKSELLGYYRQINRPGKALSYCWPDMEKIGLGDPSVIVRLNQELIADGSIRMVKGRNMWESDEYFLQ